MKHANEDLTFQHGTPGRTGSSSDPESAVEELLPDFGIRSDFGCGTVIGLGAELQDIRSNRPKVLGTAEPKQLLVGGKGPGSLQTGLLQRGEDPARVFGYL